MYLLSKPIFRAKWLTYAELKVLVDLKVFTKPSKLHSNQKSLSISFPCWNIHQSSSENSALASCLHHPPPQLLKKTSSPLFKPLCKCPPLSCPGDLIISHFFHSSILYASLIPDFCRACPPTHTHTDVTQRTSFDRALGNLGPLLLPLICPRLTVAAWPGLSVPSQESGLLIHPLMENNEKPPPLSPWLSCNSYNSLSASHLCPTLFTLPCSSPAFHQITIWMIPGAHRGWPLEQSTEN